MYMYAELLRLRIFLSVTDGFDATFRCNSAVLCSHLEPDCMIAGCYDKKVYHIDPRAAAVQFTKNYHKQPVLCMAVDDRNVITGSEDGTVVVYDRRAGTVYKRIEVR